MVGTIKSVKARERRFWRDRGETHATSDVALPTRATAPARVRSPLATVNARFAGTAETVAPIPKDASNEGAGPEPLSVRAENVLKELAAELTGESPPKGRWIPPDSLLRKLTFRHLKTARNCGPQTIDEIVEWAATRGVVIQKPFHAGKSLSAMWRDLIAKFSSGEFTTVELAEALERSIRRKNTKIPVALQSILLQILISGS